MHQKALISCRKQPRGQATVELAFVLPIFLLLLVGIMEVARVIFIYNAVYTASREAARYGASTGLATSGVHRYDDCAGMRAQAKNTGILAQLTDADIAIAYDSGPDALGNTVVKGTCTGAENVLELGDRVVVTVTKTYTTLVPIANFTFPITSTTGRTLIKDLDVNWIPTPIP